MQLYAVVCWLCAVEKLRIGLLTTDIAGLKLIASVVKPSAGRLFIQYTGEAGSGTIKVPFSSPTADFEITTYKVENVLTLAEFIRKEKFRMGWHGVKKATSITLNVNGNPNQYTLDDNFFEQNPTNIHIKKLRKHGTSWRVPGSSIVTRVNDMSPADFFKS